MELGVFAKALKEQTKKHKTVEGFYLTHWKCLLIPSSVRKGYY